ncbi:MAG: 16S rRNA processing protein RimM [Ignavibacteriales bacterium]|nr:16S rRNA processing protein RimM [Ignavibacteriales bacterium]
MKNDNFIIIGKIKSCQKREGYLLIIPVSNYFQRFFNLRYVLIDIFGDLRKFYIEEVSFDMKDIYVKFLNFNTFDDISFIIGKNIFIDSSDELVLQKDSYFIHDLIDCSVYKGKLFLGKLVNVLSLSANDVYVIEDNNGKEILIPALKKIIKMIDIKDKKLFLSEDFELVDD